ncbi:hypothetical protein [Azohydromonas australica]|uniref:hypothetical protein n=1 Tax=Azohydromonas australica TaxID=364039 RepID=UPI001EE411D4|nr:hypothetical protein [Azohydromonas australica]
MKSAIAATAARPLLPCRARPPWSHAPPGAAESHATRLPLPVPNRVPEVLMPTITVATPATRPPRRRNAAAVLLALAVLALGLASPAQALDLVGFTGIDGPMTSALTQIAALGPGIKALVGFIGFVVALISLAALRNFGPVLSYVGLAIFAAVGLVIGGAIMGAVV